jgi:methanogenic corrinoid protein MtbC1
MKILRRQGKVAVLEEIKEALMAGNANKVKELTQKALDEGIAPTTIINDGLIAAMNIIGVKFKNNEDNPINP